MWMDDPQKDGLGHFVVRIPYGDELFKVENKTINKALAPSKLFKV